MNFYHIFCISLRSAELILYYHIIYCHRFSHILSCAFIYYTFHIPFSFIYFMYFLCVHLSCYIAYCFSCSITYSFIYFCTFIYFLYFSCVHLSCYSLLLFMFYYIFFHILFMSSYTVFLVLVTVYYHRIIVICFSYHIIYFIHFLYIYFSFSFMFMLANTLAANMGNNYMYPKVLSLYETVISI